MAEMAQNAEQTQPAGMATVDIGSASASVPDVRYEGQGIHRDRPFSASQRTTASTTSKSSRSPYIYHTTNTTQKFFSYKPGHFEKALEDVKASCINADVDGAFVAGYLLTEIDHWDCEKEKVVVVCEKSVMIVKYDFIASKIYDAKRMLLHNIQKIQMGDFEYPSYSMMYPRKHGGVRVSWDKNLDVPFATRWNPFSSYVPYWTFCHHPILYYEKEMETATYNVDEFYETLVTQTKAAYRAEKPAENVEVVEANIVIESYASVASLIFNQSQIGFSKERGGVSF